MIVVGLTGGIGSGKSTVANMLAEFGAAVIDADVIARQVVLPGSAVWRKLVDEFGKDIINKDGVIDRRKLAECAFATPERVDRLNQITHPEIMKRIMTEVDRAAGQNEVVVVDAPLLYEVGMEECAGEVWVVYVDEDTQMERLSERGDVGAADGRRRMRAQIPLRDKAMRADVVIDNSGSMENTNRQVKKQWQRLVGKELG